METKKKKKKIQINLFTKQRQTHRLGKQAYGYQRGQVRWWAGMDWGFETGMCTLWYRE